jgi:fucose 4-O-acetylase-like acetyltransferase
MNFNGIYFWPSLVLFLLCHYVYDDTIDLNLRIYDSFIISTMQALLGIYLCLSLASLLSNSVCAARFLGYIGSGTLFILLFHSYIQDKLFGLLLRPMGESLANGLCSLVGAVALPLLLWECFRRSPYLSVVFLPKTATVSGLRGRRV